MEDKDRILDEIFNNDPFGLLHVKPIISNVKTADERLSASFEEINQFIAKNEREPQPNLSNIAEYQLYSRLKSLREDEEKMILLDPLDTYGLLKVEKKEINSIDDIFNDDILGIFDDGDAQSLFEFKHTPREIARAEADFIARRKPCKNFKDYEEMFKSVQADLASGKRKLLTFKETMLKPGSFYVNQGVLLFLESVDYQGREWSRGPNEGNRIREFKDGRTKTIFENGTSSNMYFRSLAKALISEGKAVTDNNEETIEEFTENFNSITEEDKEAGYIYVLSTKSNDPKIKEINNLYKIGYATTPVELRIKNAEKEPTYLLAPVKIEAEYKTFNLNTQKFELLIHNFFGHTCLNIDVFDKKGTRHVPREWFIVPLNIIDEVINLIVTGQILDYKYDSANQILLKK
jgi:hypothetical protein